MDLRLKNAYRIQGTIAYLITARGTVRLDVADLPKLADYNTWNISARGDVVCYHEQTVMGRRVRKVHKLHRVLMNAPEGMVVDHINHDRTDNRRLNLRICTALQNSYNCQTKKNNVSGRAGVRWDRQRQKWVARIKVDYRDVHLGRFPTIEEAVEARRAAEVKYFKEFAPYAQAS